MFQFTYWRWMGARLGEGTLWFSFLLSFSGLPLIIHFKIPWLFPDFSLTFYSFPYPLTDPKTNIIFMLYFNGVKCITSNLRVTLKKRISSAREPILPLRVAPNAEENFLKTACRSHLHVFSNSLTFPWLSKFFLNFPGHPQNFLVFPWPGKNFIFQIFSLTVATL